MGNDRYVNRDDDFLDPEDVNSAPASASEASDASDASSSDPASEVPVPLAMTPAEIDERAKAVDAVRSRGRGRSDRDDSGMVA